ncbi:MAG: hypothetical protein IPJ79_18775 [Bacteroidetes bacterium]|nr:hypothetical protein [Bacteroidota bacterium]
MPDINPMSDQEKLCRAQIDKIYDYTKFHIGIYATLIAGMIALQTLYSEKANISAGVFVTVISFFFISAVSGAIIASSILDMYRNYKFWDVGTSENFWSTKIGPHTYKWLLPKHWAMIEHISFWIGITFAVVSTICKELLSTPSCCHH